MNTSLIALLLAFVVFCVAFAGTGLVRSYSLRKGVMDNPNHRSSHSVPTPRGGGAAIVFAFLCGLLSLQFLLGFDVFITVLMFAASLVAVVGFVDDHQHVPARVRLAVHAVSAAGVVLAVPGAVLLDLGLPTAIPVAGWWLCVVVVGVVWLLNLTNFMDGIDGLAGVQTLTAAGLVALFGAWSGQSPQFIWPSLFLAMAALGFLCWNFPPAKIFMGDVGSGTLGLVFGALAWWHASVDSKWLYVWLILLGVFVVDATYTLLRRAARREKLSQPHRTHAFQLATQRLKSHRKVTLSVLAIIVCWLAPWAALVAFSGLNGMLSLLLAYSPLLALAIYLGAGRAEPPQANQP
jgi:Fuc2NAc and GlcNAc transferase